MDELLAWTADHDVPPVIAVQRAADRFRTEPAASRPGTASPPARTTTRTTSRSGRWSRCDEHLVAPGAGFDWHAHRGVRHRSAGCSTATLRHEVGRPGSAEVRAGRGAVPARPATAIRHAERNASRRVRAALRPAVAADRLGRSRLRSGPAAHRPARRPLRRAHRQRSTSRPASSFVGARRVARWPGTSSRPATRCAPTRQVAAGHGHGRAARGYCRDHDDLHDITRRADRLGAGPRLHGHEPELRADGLGRVDGHHPPGARARRHVPRHRERVRRRPQRGAGRPRAGRAPRPGAARHQARHRRHRGVGQPPIRGKAAYVKQACEDSLLRLGVDHIDLYYLHRPPQDAEIEETVGAMAELVQEGKVRSPRAVRGRRRQLRRAHAVHPIAAVQSEYSLWTRDPETLGVVDAMRELGVGLVPFSPLGRGFLTGTLDRSTFGADRHAQPACRASPATRPTPTSALPTPWPRWPSARRRAGAGRAGVGARAGRAPRHPGRPDPRHQAGQVAGAERRRARRHARRRRAGRARRARRRRWSAPATDPRVSGARRRRS